MSEEVFVEPTTTRTTKRPAAKKSKAKEDDAVENAPQIAEAIAVEKPKRGRPKKVIEPKEKLEAADPSEPKATVIKEQAAPVEKPKRGRPPKKDETKEKVKEAEPENVVANNKAVVVEAQPSPEPTGSTNSNNETNQVARCFSNIVSVSDVKIEADRLKRLYRNQPDSTWTEFLVCVNRLLAQYKATSQLLLCCDLASTFVLYLPANVQEKYINRLMGALKAKDKAVRLRAAHLIRLWLRSQTEVAEDIHARLIDTMLESVNDKNPQVRQEILACLEFLQDPENAEDKVIRQLVLSAQHDSVAKVRKTALRVVAPSELSIEAFVSRTKDESDEVRVACWKELEERFKMQWFPPAKLNEMFEQGLDDFSQPCKNQCAKTLLRWFNAERRSDVISLLESFDLAIDPEEETLVMKILDILQPKVSKDKLKDLSPGTCLTRAASIWLRYLCEKKMAEDMDLVTASNFMESLTQILQVMRNSSEDHYDSGAFMARQLVLGCSSLNLVHDPFGRAGVIRTLSEALLVEDFPASLVEPMTRCIKSCFLDETQFIVDITTNVVSFLSELSPLDQVKADILKAEQLIEDLTRQRDYASLPGLVSEIESLKEKEKSLLEAQTDTEAKAPTFSRLVRSTALVCAILKLLPRAKDASLLQDLLETACVPAVQSPESEARLYGVEALGLLALRDLAIAKSHGMLLARTFFENEREDPDVRLKALQVMFDLVTQFGKQVSETEQEFDILIKYLMSLLEVDREDEIRALAGIGLTKMLFLGRVAYPGLVQCLLIVLFHPTTDLNPKLKQSLLTFFAEYKTSKIVLEASEPLIDAMIDPTAESMCEDLPFDKVLERISFLLSRGEDQSLMIDFALILLKKIAKFHALPEHASHCKSIAKAISALSIPMTASEKLLRLRHVVSATLESDCFESDRTAIKQMEKLSKSLQRVFMDDIPPLSQVVLDEIQAMFPNNDGQATNDASHKSEEAEDEEDEEEEEEQNEEEGDDDQFEDAEA